jgi:hypothetical protein
LPVEEGELALFRLGLWMKRRGLVSESLDHSGGRECYMMIWPGPLSGVTDLCCPVLSQSF